MTPLILSWVFKSPKAHNGTSLPPVRRNSYVPRFVANNFSHFTLSSYFKNILNQTAGLPPLRTKNSLVGREVRKSRCRSRNQTCLWPWCWSAVLRPKHKQFGGVFLCCTLWRQEADEALRTTSPAVLRKLNKRKKSVWPFVIYCFKISLRYNFRVERKLWQCPKWVICLCFSLRVFFPVMWSPC